VVITVIGEVTRGKAVERGGARPGDRIYVSGTLGNAELGLRLLRAGQAHRFPAKLLKTHVRPAIRLELGTWLAGKKVASAMIDISDGLSTDLSHLCVASRVGAQIWADRLPLVQSEKALKAIKRDALDLALNGGEDYELLFTVPKTRESRLRNAPAALRLTSIGEVTRGRQILLVRPSGKTSAIVPHGWDPFRGQATRIR